MSVQGDDWRLQGQEKYLLGVELHRSHWIPSSPANDHDHCEFCSAKFMGNNVPGVLHEGYTTATRYHWVCEQCFTDFKERFQWKDASRA